MQVVEAGFWRHPAQSAVSYPEDGADRCRVIEDWSYWFQHRNACIAAAVRRFPPAGPVWDIGGGNGVVAKALADAGFPAVVVEPGPSGIRNARQRGLPVVQAAWSEDLVRPGSLEAAGLFDVIEHLEDDRAFLRSVRNALKPGGLLYLTVPAHPFLWSDEDRAAGHFRRYTVQALQDALAAGGFRVLYLTGFFACLRLPIWLLRSLPDRLALGRVSGKAYQQEHRLPRGPLGALISGALGREVARIRAGRSRSSGASLLAVAARHD